MQNQQQQLQQQNQDKRYTFFICNNPNIFWWTNSIDKPSERIFYSIINAVSWIKVNTPNFINAYTAEFVVDKKDYYNYAKLVDTATGKTTYWFFNSLQKTLRNAFLYELKMDIFSSYAYDFLYQVKEKGLNVFINRSNCNTFLKSSYVNNQIDDLLPEFTGFYPLKLRNNRFGINGEWWKKEYYFYENGEKAKLPTFTLKKDDVNPQDQTIWGTPSTTNYWHLKFNPDNSEMNVYCDVYTHGNQELLLIPINDTIWGFSANTVKQNLAFHAVANTVINPIISKELRTHPAFINRYKGCYCIPFFDVLMTQCKGTFTYYEKIDDDGSGITSRALTGGFLIPITSGYEKLSEQMRVYNPQHIIKNDVLTRFNKDSRTVNKYVLSKFTQMMSGDRWCSYFNDDLRYIVDYDYSNIAGFKFYTSTRFDIDKNNAITYSAGETLPIAINEYAAYVASSISQRNTNLEIHNRDSKYIVAQSVLGGLQSIFNGAVGGATTGGVGGGIIGGLAGGVDAFFNITRAKNQQKDYQKRLNAELADKARASSTSITLSTNEKSNLYNKLNKISKFRQGSIVARIDWWNTTLWLNGYNELDYNTIKASNKVVWKNGYKINMSVNCKEIESVGQYLDRYKNGALPFLYWDWQFDDEYFKSMFPTLDIELLETVKMCINGEIRFWDLNKPDFTVEIDINA